MTTHAMSPPDPTDLHRATDTLNESLVLFEKTLQDLNLGVSAQVMIEDDPATGMRSVLSFMKAGGVFRIIVLSGNKSDRESLTANQLIHCSRETRLRVVPLLPALYDALLRAYNDEVERVYQATTDVGILASKILAAGKVRK